MPLTAPYELLDLADGESRTFTVLSAERGEGTIHPIGERSPKVIPILRLRVEPADKPAGPPYYDVTARTLQAQLEPALFSAAYAPRIFTITKRGVAPAARFTVASRPLEVSSPG